MATCPQFDAEIEVDEFDVDKGDQLSCPHCGSNLEVTGLAPLELDAGHVRLRVEAEGRRGQRGLEGAGDAGIGRGQDQRKLLGCGEQNLRRVATLPLALLGRRVAGAGLDPDWQSHLGNWPLQVARDVDRERLER